MASPSPTDEPLQVLKHDPVPGYLTAFLIAFATMGIYLALILVSSPGPAKGHHGTGDSHGGTETEASH